MDKKVIILGLTFFLVAIVAIALYLTIPAPISYYELTITSTYYPYNLTLANNNTIIFEGSMNDSYSVLLEENEYTIIARNRNGTRASSSAKTIFVNSNQNITMHLQEI